MNTPFVVWRDEYRTGVGFVDEQHQRLVEVINTAHTEVVSVGCDQEESFRRLIKQVIDYMKYHFGSEEKWMIEYDYPDYPRQKQEHTAFVKRILQDTAQFDSGDNRAAIRFIYFLRSWVLAHIVCEDAKFTDFCREHPEVPVD